MSKKFGSKLRSASGAQIRIRNDHTGSDSDLAQNSGSNWILILIHNTNKKPIGPRRSNLKNFCYPSNSNSRNIGPYEGLNLSYYRISYSKTNMSLNKVKKGVYNNNTKNVVNPLQAEL